MLERENLKDILVSNRATELLNDPDYVNDLKSNQGSRVLATKWFVAKTTINKHRGVIGKKDGQPTKAKVAQAKEYEESWSGDDGTLSVVVHEDMSPDQVLRKFGWNPEERRIVGDAIEERHWTSAGEYQHYYKFKTERGAQGEDLTVTDLPLLYSQISARTVEPPVMDGAERDRALVVIWADIQVGKTGSRGGTPELIERVAEKREKLKEYALEQSCNDAFFLSVGDEVESFENTPQQAFTNDLSFPDQLDLELTFELDMLTTLAGLHETVTVAGCSSNHCRWRAGKNALGKPADDYGLYIKKQLGKALALNSSYDGVRFVYPEPWDETVAIDVQGTRIGLAHGHQVNNPNMIESWWTKQAFGGQATAEADILCTGHFHTFRAQPMGRSLKTGKNRWWLQAPTLDNGSDWFRNLQGSDSDAGMLVFCVDENGLDLQSLTIL